jgi:hypothetical protein
MTADGPRQNPRPPVEALADPAVRNRSSDQGFDIPPREQRTPEWLGVLHKAEIEKWWPIIKAANIKGEWAEAARGVTRTARIPDGSCPVGVKLGRTDHLPGARIHGRCSPESGPISMRLDRGG